MADEHADPGELTERFRAFAETEDPAPGKALPRGLIGAVIVVALVVLLWVLIAN